jgi:hypothetical protein
MGRPTKYDEKIVEQLVKVFELDVPDKTACEYVGLSPDTYYRWLKEKPDFSDRIVKAKRYARIASGSVVKEAIEKKDVQSARWWLEKKHPDEFHPSGTNVNVSGEKVLVIPSELLKKHKIETKNAE